MRGFRDPKKYNNEAQITQFVSDFKTTYDYIFYSRTS